MAVILTVAIKMKMILRRAANTKKLNGGCQKYTYEQAFFDIVPSRFPCSMSSRWFYFSIFDYLLFEVH